MYVLSIRPPGLRPIWTGFRWPLEDVQGALPRSWCRKCGKEVFLRGREYCPICEEEEHKNVQNELSQPL